MSLGPYSLFIQEIILSLGALALLTLEMLKPSARRLALGIAYASLALAFAAGANLEGMTEFFMADSLASGFSLLILAGTAVAIMLSQSELPLPRRLPTFLSLVLFASTGCLFLVKASDFLFAFLAIELISISSFILVAYERRDVASLEGAVKYFLVGAFAAAVAIYGISLYYGASGTTAFRMPDGSALVQTPGGELAWRIALTGVLLIFSSFGFKASIVPFHFWAPDAYQAAPTSVAAYLSVVPKLAAFGVMLHVFSMGSGEAGVPAFLHMGELETVMALLACLTMTVGNVSAIHQNNLKRLLAYSSIAQAGYIMIGVLAASRLGVSSVLFYGLAYLLMNFGAFACAMWVAHRKGSYEIEGCDGLALTHLPFALCFTVFLLSLAGIPPLVGFLGKYFVFASAIQAKWLVLVAVVGALNSVISVYYYLRIVYRMFFVETASSSWQAVPSLLGFAVFALAAGTILFGLYPAPLLALSGF